MAGTTLHLDHRFVLHLVFLDRGRSLRVTGEADAPGLALDQFCVIGAMGGMAAEAVAVGKRRMGVLFGHTGRLLLVTGETEFTLFNAGFEKTGAIASMGGVAGTTLPTSKWLMQAEQPHFPLGLRVTGEAEGRFMVLQQLSLVGLVGGVAIETAPFFGRRMGPAGLRIDLAIMTGVAEHGRVGFEQRLPGAGVSAMAGQTVSLGGRRMNAPGSLVLAMLVAVQTDPGRRLGQHAGIVAGMDGMAGLAVAILDRLVLRRRRQIVVADKADAAFNGLQGYFIACNLVAVVAIATLHWRMNHLLEQSGLAGTVLGMAVDAVGADRVVLMGRTESGIIRHMAGGAQSIRRHAQQSPMIAHVRIVAGIAAITERGVYMAPGKRLPIVAGIAGLIGCNLEQIGERRVVRQMTVFAAALHHRLVHRFLFTNLFKAGVARQTQSRRLLPH
jgi:hypothetical protein